MYTGSLGTNLLATLALATMSMISSIRFLLIDVLRFIVGLADNVVFPATAVLWSL
jgi:hypothetical protein